MMTIFLGLGSNKGDRKKNILKAIKLLKKSGQKVLRLSELRETKPYGYKKQKKFLNAVAKLKTKLLPSELLELCKKIEKKIGRTKSFRWGPREIDVDILFYGKKVIKNKKLTIPHSDLHNRNFILIPLVEIAPNFVHPVLKKQVSEMYSTIQGEK
ncbi:MAG: 2-amino-4-hydroxy-6-hydroxymethyldihydropteridine diphosphokinase [Elusimicrobia bacterium]|nr:2-amino-4-hydroxy-6-hydroxymethyldihydropteridine diphosphokinase [Elusimicrobiota bacterium]